MSSLLSEYHVDGCANTDFEHSGPCRDKRDKPRILLPDGKTVRSYTRTSGYGKVLEDLNALMGWKCRTTALGLLARPDLMASVAAYRDDRDALQQVVNKALEIGGANKASDRGSAVHFMTEVLDKGQALENLPPEVQGDLSAYESETFRWQVEHKMIEAFCVQDDLKAAGTFDRLVEIDGETYIADLKTSSSVNYPHSWAIQLAIYAHSDLYDFRTGVRTPFDCNQERAVLISLPAEQSECTLYWIDIERGWKAATELVPAMKAWRNTRDLLIPFDKEN